ncbi:sigma-70 family RNA polymerase sigma factor [Streptomyces sp. PA5.6]|uniref:sigma-70 family RNA polymerase sigma factor n=1 Tax=Streptomyces sp. PA5.6 TaxID=3035651 RepID=UPI0039047EDA
MSESNRLAEGFEQNRVRLRAVAYRMLGSLAEADDAVQEAWLRLSRADAAAIASLDAWLTTVLVRICLNMLRSRNTRREDLMGVHVPDPVVSHVEGVNPEDAALLADSVGLALQVVLDELTPAERLAFVLHDMFDLPYDEIAPLAGCSTANARQLASRARRRVRAIEGRAPDPDMAQQRQAVDAFFTAARNGELNDLVAVLHPNVVLRADEGAARPEESVVVHGAAVVAGRAVMFERPGAAVRPVLVNGAAGVVVTVQGKPVSVMGFTVSGGKIVQIDVMADPERLARLDLAFLD